MPQLTRRLFPWLRAKAAGLLPLYRDPALGTVVDGAGNQLIVISSNPPSDADGRPDGTIYIRTP